MGKYDILIIIVRPSPVFLIDVLHDLLVPSWLIFILISLTLWYWYGF